MNITQRMVWGIACGASMSVCGCMRHQISVPAPVPDPPAQLGSSVNPSFEIQELHGEASDFVIYEHEFAGNSSKLTPEGESHLRQIAARLPQVPFPVIVENASPDVGPDDPGFVPCADIDSQRRATIAAALTLMGVPGAGQRVIVGPPLSAGITAGEADRSYNRSIGGFGNTLGGNRAGGVNGGVGAGGMGFF